MKTEIKHKCYFTTYSAQGHEHQRHVLIELLSTHLRNFFCTAFHQVSVFPSHELVHNRQEETECSGHEVGVATGPSTLGVEVAETALQYGVLNQPVSSK